MNMELVLQRLHGQIEVRLVQYYDSIKTLLKSCFALSCVMFVHIFLPTLPRVFILGDKLSIAQFSVS